MKENFAEANEDNQEAMFHSDTFVSFVVLSGDFFDFSLQPR